MVLELAAIEPKVASELVEEDLVELVRASVTVVEDVEIIGQHLGAGVADVAAAGAAGGVDDGDGIAAVESGGGQRARLAAGGRDALVKIPGGVERHQDWAHDVRVE